MAGAAGSGRARDGQRDRDVGLDSVAAQEVRVVGGTLAARVAQEKLGRAFALMLVTVAGRLAVSTALLGGAPS
ncbi:MAG TPA: hypothetical protein VNT32_07065 [Thermoleophilaceae bacterium]|nr:hypothetical protein [Thermoleophilaceae bacterium]